ncbi:SGNH/GDSL hydrolase family protein [Dethiosulfatarculus sandiegensis]|uniref:SGNH hydrolase-type esterase domain-containing protein n=1 Tax=Dethiosulfatarculus sandiegensis TaxID=1429043 RepID=A0A0D2J889_9BACT|nr:SGNH/GDSL hydrolase family protein [Dethiosulfatarculus sandiegensis]KIX11916.1 hypothetical protein X474_22035 [Dethiosulfatarculus sandiegensis]
MKKSNTPRTGIYRILSLLLLALSFCYALWLGVAPRQQLETLASQRYTKWAQDWAKAQDPIEINLNRELLPSTFPGPLDTWAQGKRHSLLLDFEVEPGDYTLRLLFFDIHEAAPPKLSLKLNKQKPVLVQLKPGSGRPAPYADLNPGLTVNIPLKINKSKNQLVITNLQGSWAAPARLRLTQGYEFSPAKLGYTLFTDPISLGILLLGLAGFIFFGHATRHSPGQALASVALLGITCLICLLLAELGFRAYLIKIPQARRLSVQKNMAAQDLKGMNYSFGSMISPNPDMEITYQLKPNLEGNFAGKKLRTNSQNMRGKEVALKAQSGVFRLMGLGDSVFFGWGVEEDQTALVRAGLELAERLKRPVEALNLSCPSYNTSVEVAVYRKKGRKFKPQAVVLCFVENDFEPPSMMFEPVRLWTMEKSYIHEQLRRRLALAWRDAGSESEEFFTTQRKNQAERQGKSLNKKWRDRLEAYYSRMAGEKAVAAALDDLAKMLKEDKIPGLVVYAPNRLAPLDAKTKFVLDSADRSGLLILDMTQVYRNWFKKNQGTMQSRMWVHPKDPHPNELGHSLMGEAIAEKLIHHVRD